MTVLAAYWAHDGRPTRPGCAAMLRAQLGRTGQCTVLSDGALSLGSTLAAEAGPIDGGSGAYVLLADARLDNRRDFVRGLGLSDREATAVPDPRLMLLCIERWGTDVIARFVGDFALVLWDRRHAQLLLARDFAGQRPLHLHRAPGFVAVASLAKGLHALPDVPRGVDEARLLAILAGQPHNGPSSCFAGIERIEPGEMRTLSKSNGSSRPLWTPPTDMLRLASHEDYAEGLLERLDEAVADRLRGAGAIVGTHLSAGLDSAAVTTSAARQFQGRILAFTAVPPGPATNLPAGRFGDEAALAARTAAAHANIEHVLITSGDRLALDSLADEQRHFERPDLNLPNLDWGNRINAAAAAAGIGTLLTGLAGNTTISFDAGSAVRSAARRMLPPRLTAAIDRLRHGPPTPSPRAVMRVPLGLEAIAAAFDAPAPADLAEARAQVLRRVDPGTYAKGVLLRWGISMLDPTADRRLVDYCLRVPAAQYRHGGTARALIRTALKGRVPDEVRLEQRRGLQAPHWFAMLARSRDQARRRLEAIEQSAAAHRLLDLGAMRRLLDDWPRKTAGAAGPLIYREGFLRGLSIGEFIRIHEAATNDASRAAAGD